MKTTSIKMYYQNSCTRSHPTRCLEEEGPNNIVMAQRRAARSIAELEALVQRGKLSEDGKNWLIQAIDPFHDTQLPVLEGWPDQETIPSLVRCIKKSFNISRPTDIPAGQNWDCHIISWPWLNQIDFWDIVSRENNVLGAPAGGVNTHLHGGVQAYGTLAGADWSPTLSPTLGVAQLDPEFQKGVTRVVGMGFEVENTTAQLNLQGISYHWKMPQQRGTNQSNYLFPAGDLSGQYAHPYAVTGAAYRCPPRNSNSATLISGTRSWKAAAGNYTVVPFVGPTNPPQSVGYVQPIIDKAVHDDGINSGQAALPDINSSELLVPKVHGMHEVGGVPICAANKIYPIHMCGSIYAGLSSESSLTVRVNIYVETFPGPAELNDLTLATPSAPYDPLALQLFSECMGHMAVSTQLKNNPLGEYFAEAISDIANYAAPWLDAAGLPLGGVIARSVGKMANRYATAPNYNTPGSPKPQARGPPPPPNMTQAEEIRKLRMELRKRNAEARQKAGYKALPAPKPKLQLTAKKTPSQNKFPKK